MLKENLSGSGILDGELKLNRRNTLMAAGLLALGVPVAGLSADHGHHHKSGKHAKLIDTALDCMKTGELCMNHCLHSFKMGDKTLADCAKSVQEMLATVEALSKLAAYESKHLKGIARLCIKVCRDCEKECRKHAKHHKECKECADACKKCIRACKRVA